jgi:hypothetical protein
MVKIGFFTALTVIVTLAHSPSYADERASLAVFPTLLLDAARSLFDQRKLDARELTQQLEETLRATRRFAIFERATEILQNSVLREQDFAEGGEALRNFAERGKLANVQFIALPIITQMNISVRKIQSEEIPGQYQYRSKGFLNVRVKILDTTSAEIAFQTTRDVAISPDNDAGTRQTGPHDEYLVFDAAWHSLAHDAATQLTNSVVGSLSPIQVLQAQAADIFVNRGEGGGIVVGEIYQIFSVGDALIDPVTHEKLGYAEKLLGEVEIVRVNPRFSVARARKPLVGEVKPGDVLRPLP